VVGVEVGVDDALKEDATLDGFIEVRAESLQRVHDGRPFFLVTCE